MTAAYPLSWPAGWPRTPMHQRVNGMRRWSSQGKPWTFDAARIALSDELDRLGATNVILSTNYELRLDGKPRAGAPKPQDVGVAVYFTLRGVPKTMARDAFDRAEENIRSLTLALKALRAIEEHGGSFMMDRAFAGFEALPSPAGVRKRTWREVLNLVGETNPIREQVEHHYKIRAKTAHPDTGGSHEAMAELNRAREEALKETGNA